MSDNVAVVTVRGVQGRRIKRPDIYCHLVTGRRHEKEVISEKRFKRHGERWQRGRIKIPVGEKGRGMERKGGSERETWGVKRRMCEEMKLQEKRQENDRSGKSSVLLQRFLFFCFGPSCLLVLVKLSSLK